MTKFTPESLPHAVASLFRLNHYKVDGPIQMYGAEIDLVARPLADPFGVPVYIEVTVEYVDNKKYGNDMTKFGLVREVEPTAQMLIISSTGFSLPVRERASRSRITTLTYEELFKKFQRFDAYAEVATGDTSLADELRRLDAIYEEPDFVDDLGQHKATKYITEWRDSADASNKWLVVVGEYGTGKTALTRVLQYRWLLQYKMNPMLPLPFRVELRDFARQFDARGLLHHFLDQNNLGHISIEYIESLIRSGKIILLLDGYDEMAQYLHARERRSCLEALAELSSGGAKGILTSRPNYFTETEELQVFEILYASIQAGRYYLGKQDKELLKREERVDQLLGQFIDQFERRLEDLTPVQTQALVERALVDDPVGREVVQGILKRVFRSVDSGARMSLSGKPVIITYLLEVVEGLKKQPVQQRDDTELTEWEVYKLIIDQLMLRDFRRAPELSPEDRRGVLHRMALLLSRTETPIINEDEFRELVSKHFTKELRRFTEQERSKQTDRLFSDVRSSATLTRAVTSVKEGWRFSHNSLREYLVAEFIVRELRAKRIAREKVPISDAMRLFVSSKPTTEIQELLQLLSEIWPQRLTTPLLGQILCLMWDGALRVYSAEDDPAGTALRQICGSPVALNSAELSRVAFSSERRPAHLHSANLANSTLVAVDMTSSKLNDVDLSGSLLESVNFTNADLRAAVFTEAMLVDVILSGANLEGADFRGVQPNLVSIAVEAASGERARTSIDGVDALGYLAFNGAKTDPLPLSVIAHHHPKSPIAEKILEKLSKQSLRQRRGLTQRGAAAQDPRFARRFVKHLESQELIQTPMNRKELVEVTEIGRQRLTKFVETGELPPEVLSLLLPRQYVELEPKCK
ncbi:MAG: pentapeptide repeat-containing protein [Pseudomonadota bacterium]